MGRRGRIAVLKCAFVGSVDLVVNCPKEVVPKASTACNDHQKLPALYFQHLPVPLPPYNTDGHVIMD